LVELEAHVEKIKKTEYERIYADYVDLVAWLMMFYKTKHKIKEDDLKQIYNTADNVHQIMNKVEERENR